MVFIFEIAARRGGHKNHDNTCLTLYKYALDESPEGFIARIVFFFLRKCLTPKKKKNSFTINANFLEIYEKMQFLKIS